LNIEYSVLNIEYSNNRSRNAIDTDTDTDSDTEKTNTAECCTPHLTYNVIQKIQIANDP